MSADEEFEELVQINLRTWRVQAEARKRFEAEAQAAAPVLNAPLPVLSASYSHPSDLVQKARKLALLCWLMALCCIGMAWTAWRSKQPQGPTPRLPLLLPPSNDTRSTSAEATPALLSVNGKEVEA